jgi:hypothetical protein
LILASYAVIDLILDALGFWTNIRRIYTGSRRKWVCYSGNGLTNCGTDYGASDATTDRGHRHTDSVFCLGAKTTTDSSGYPHHAGFHTGRYTRLEVTNFSSCNI